MCTHIPGDFLDWKKTSNSFPSEADCLQRRLSSICSLPVCVCHFNRWEVACFPSPWFWTGPCDFLSPNEYGKSDVLRLLNPGLKRTRSFHSLPLGMQLPHKKSNYLDATMQWGSPSYTLERLPRGPPKYQTPEWVFLEFAAPPSHQISTAQWVTSADAMGGRRTTQLSSAKPQNHEKCFLC